MPGGVTGVPYGWYAVVFAVSAGVSYGITFPVRALASRIGYVAEPDARKVHTRVTPEAGGVGMFVAFLVAVAVAALLPAFSSQFQVSSEPLGLVLGAAAIFVVGVIDDLRDMSAPAKMAGQVVAAMILYFLGVTWFQFKVPLAGFVVLSPAITPLLTAVWVIAITNAVNLIDGLDGLAAGVVAIASAALAVYGMHLQHYGNLPTDSLGPLVAVVTCGICVGFLPHNFHPARIFMGDAGALFLGLCMAAATMLIGGRSAGSTASRSGATYFFFAPLFIPFFILGVPLVDMAWAFVRRTVQRTGFSIADKNHLHHRLLRLGHGHRRSVLILWTWTALLSGFVLFPLYVSQVNEFIPFGAAALGVALYTLLHPTVRTAREEEVVAGEGASAESALPADSRSLATVGAKSDHAAGGATLPSRSPSVATPSTTATPGTTVSTGTTPTAPATPTATASIASTAPIAVPDTAATGGSTGGSTGVAVGEGPASQDAAEPTTRQSDRTPARPRARPTGRPTGRSHVPAHPDGTGHPDDAGRPGASTDGLSFFDIVDGGGSHPGDEDGIAGTSGT